MISWLNEVIVTYELGVSVDPPDCHQTLCYLAFKKLNFVIHATLILLAGLRRND